MKLWVRVPLLGPISHAGVVEQADTAVLKSAGGNTVRVRSPSPAPLANCQQVSNPLVHKGLEVLGMEVG